MTPTRNCASCVLGLLSLLILPNCMHEKDQPIDLHTQVIGIPLVKPKGLPTESGTSALIGATGGVLWYDDLLRMEIPPGAVNEPTLFGIQPIYNTLEDSEEKAAFRFTPENVTFKNSVRISFQYHPETEGNPRAREVAYQREDGVWCSVSASLNETQRIITVETDHFSDWTWFDRLSLRKDNETVTAGKTVNLKLLEQVLGELIPSNHIDVVPLAALDDIGVSKDVTVSGWKIISGPGTLEPKINSKLVKGDAVYTAPSTVDEVTEVEIQVEVESKNGYIRDRSAPEGRRKLGKLILLTTIQLVPENSVQLSLNGNGHEMNGFIYAINGMIKVRATNPDESVKITLDFNGQDAGIYSGGDKSNQSMFYYATSNGSSRTLLNNFYRSCENEYIYNGTGVIQFVNGYAEGSFTGNLYSPNVQDCEIPESSTVSLQFKIKTEH